LFSLFSAACH
jgi:hypothetical protein